MRPLINNSLIGTKAAIRNGILWVPVLFLFHTLFSISCTLPKVMFLGHEYVSGDAKLFMIACTDFRINGAYNAN